MIENTEKITKEFCVGKVLLFFPKTADEAEFIQQKIFAMGYSWGNRNVHGVTYLRECVAAGMLLDKGELYTNPSNTDREKGVHCTAGQLELEPGDMRGFFGDELTREVFNRLSARLDAIEARGAASAKEIAEIREALGPVKIEKTLPPKSTPGQ